MEARNAPTKSDRQGKDAITGLNVSQQIGSNFTYYRMTKKT